MVPYWRPACSGSSAANLAATARLHSDRSWMFYRYQRGSACGRRMYLYGARPQAVYMDRYSPIDS